MNPHLCSHTQIGDSDKATPLNTHMHSAQPFSRKLCCRCMSCDWLPSPRRDKHVLPKCMRLQTQAFVCLLWLLSFFQRNSRRGNVAVCWLAVGINCKEFLFRCIRFTCVERLFLWLKFQEYEEFNQAHGFASSTFPICSSLSSYGNKKVYMHCLVNIELVWWCFHQIWYLKWEMFSFALASVFPPIGA